MKRILYGILLTIAVITGIVLVNETKTYAEETDAEKIGGVYASGTDYYFNSTIGAYSPMFDELKAVNTNGKKIDLDVEEYPFYTSYVNNSFGEKLTTNPEIGKTYYSYIIINCSEPYNTSISKNLINISIEGFKIEYITSRFTSNGLNIRLDYSATRIYDTEIGGVTATGRGYYYDGTGVYVPNFESITVVNTDGMSLSFDADSYDFYSSYSKGTFGEKQTTNLIKGETYYSYLILSCPNSYDATIDESLINISIEGFDVEYLDYRFTDMGFNIRIDYAATKKFETEIGGVTANGTGYKYDSSNGVYVPAFDSLKTLNIDGQEVSFEVESGPFYTSYSQGYFGEKLTIEPVAGQTYYSYLRIECPNGYFADIDEALLNINIDGFKVAYVSHRFSDMGFNVNIIYSATRKFDIAVGGVKMGNGDYLKSGSASTSTVKPDDNYAYYCDGILTLVNYEYEGEGIYNIDDWGNNHVIFAKDDLTIVLKGNNRLAYKGDSLSSFGIWGKGNLKVKGEKEEDSLSIEGVHQYAIYNDGYAVNVESGKINIVSNGKGILGQGVKITGGEVNINVDGYAVYSDDSSGVSVSGGKVTLSSTKEYGAIYTRKFTYDTNILDIIVSYEASGKPVTEYNTDNIAAYKYIKLEAKELYDELEVLAGADKKEVTVGDKVEFTATVTGGKAPYKYSYIVHNKTTNQWSRLKDKSDSNTFTWEAKSNGKRMFYVDVTDADGKTVRSNGIEVITSNAKPLSAISTSSVKENIVGGKVIFKVEAVGGVGPYTYSYIVHNKTTNKWSRVKDKSTSNTFEWTAGSKGTRLFYVDVTDSKGTTVRTTALTVVTGEKKALSATSSASATKITVGGKVTFKAEATGGTGEYKYSYIVHNKTTNKWLRLKDKTTANTFTWTSTSVGTMVFYVDVTDSSGTTVRCEAITVVTAGKELPLLVTVSASKTEVNKGEQVTFTATATGGKAPYTYSYIVYNEKTKEWCRIKDNITSNTFTWTAGSAGSRLFYVDVKDANGKIVRTTAIRVVTK